VTAAVRIDRVGVVIPVRNEELLPPRCLSALAAAIAAVRDSPALARPTVIVVIVIVIVLDRCTDRSASVAADWPQFSRSESTAGPWARRGGRVPPRRSRGRAACGGPIYAPITSGWPRRMPTPRFRRTGARNRRARHRTCLRATRTMDSAAHARRGASARTRGQHRRSCRPVQCPGGFAPVDTGEDVRLVVALRSLSVIEARTALIPVLTSGRLTGRAPAGFAGYLQDSATEAQPP